MAIDPRKYLVEQVISNAIVRISNDLEHMFKNVKFSSQWKGATGVGSCGMIIDLRYPEEFTYGLTNEIVSHSLINDNRDISEYYIEFDYELKDNFNCDFTVNYYLKLEEPQIVKE